MSGEEEVDLSRSGVEEVLTVGAVDPQDLQAGEEDLGVADVLLDQVDSDVESSA